MLLYNEEQATILAEQKDLQAKLIELNVILNGQQGPDTTDEEWNLLNVQAFAMRSYNYVLLARIRLIKKEIRKATTS